VRKIKVKAQFRRGKAKFEQLGRQIQQGRISRKPKKIPRQGEHSGAYHILADGGVTSRFLSTVDAATRLFMMNQNNWEFEDGLI
jgi:hypothetical protein